MNEVVPCYPASVTSVYTFAMRLGGSQSKEDLTVKYREKSQARAKRAITETSCLKRKQTNLLDPRRREVSGAQHEANSIH